MPGARRGPHRLAAAVAWLTPWLLTACAALPEGVQRDASQALTDVTATPLAREAALVNGAAFAALEHDLKQSHAGVDQQRASRHIRHLEHLMARNARLNKARSHVDHQAEAGEPAEPDDAVDGDGADSEADEATESAAGTSGTDVDDEPVAA